MEIRIGGGLSGRVSDFMVQTFSLLFFPEDNRFGRNKSGNMIDVDFDGERVTVGICYGGAEARRTRAAVFEDDKGLLLEVGRAFYGAAGELTGVKPPWGIHTGIRPAKAAGEGSEALVNKYLMSASKARLALEVYKNGQSAVRGLGERAFSLYISVPFCPTRCGYCSFVSHATPKLLGLIPAYIKKLAGELELIAGIARGLELKSVYIGGGTPATLGEGELELVLRAVRDNFEMSGILEYTVECGRADVITRGKLDALKKHGVSRVSVNPQSLSDEVLAANGRNHTADDFFRAFGLAREAGLKNINADMIVGLPGETRAGMLGTAARLAELEAENITVHTLCIKKSAELKKIAEYAPDAPELNRALEDSYGILRGAGYKPYYLYRQKYSAGNLENTGFSLEGRECLYNIYMMDEVQTIFGAGAGAITKLVRGGRIERIANYKYPFEYIAHDFQIERESSRAKLRILED